MKRICFLNPTEFIRRPIFELASKLTDDNYKVGILTPKRKKKGVEHFLRDNSKIEILRYGFFRPIPVEFEWPFPKLDYFSKLKYISKNYDVVHMWTHFYPSVLFAMFYFKVLKKKKVVLTMDTLPGESFKSGFVMDLAFKIYNRTIGKWIINRSDEFTVYGKSISKIIKAGVKPNKKIKAIPTGIKHVDISKVEKSNIKEELSLKKNTKVVFFIGLVGTRKGIDTMINVAKKFENSNVAFLVAGDSPKRKYWSQKAPQNMHFLGVRKDIWNIFKVSDVFFFPSRGEGLAGVIMEAMMSKVPVVSSRIPCTTDLIKNNDSGYLCEMDDERAYIKSIKLILSDKKLSSRIAKNAYKTITTKYDWDVIKKQYEVCYE